MADRKDAEAYILSSMEFAAQQYAAAFDRIEDCWAGDKRKLDLIDRYAHTLHELAEALQSVTHSNALSEGRFQSFPGHCIQDVP